MPKKILILTIILILCNLLAAGILCAQTSSFGQGLTNVGTVSGLQRYPLSTYIVNIVKALLTLVGIAFTAILIYGGFLYMTSAGEPEKVKKGKNAIKSAIIGILIIMAAYAITYFIAQVIELQQLVPPPEGPAEY